MTAAKKLAPMDTCLTAGTVERILSGTVEVRHGAATAPPLTRSTPSGEETKAGRGHPRRSLPTAI